MSVDIFQKYRTFSLRNKLSDIGKMLVIYFDRVLNWQEIIKKITGIYKSVQKEYLFLGV